MCVIQYYENNCSFHVEGNEPRAMGCPRDTCSRRLGDRYQLVVEACEYAPEVGVDGKQRPCNRASRISYSIDSEDEQVFEGLCREHRERVEVQVDLDQVSADVEAWLDRSERRGIFRGRFGRQTVRIPGGLGRRERLRNAMTRACH